MPEQKLTLGLIPGPAAESLATDWNGTLTRLREIGYAGLEMSAGTLEKSGLSAADCRKSLLDHGLEPMSFFAGWGPFDTEAEQIIAQASELGCDYMVWGWAPARGADQVDEVLPIMHKAAGMVRAAGMTLLYHNHDHEFLAVADGVTSYDWLMGQFHPELLQAELDIGWVGYGKQDVVATIEKYAGRVPILHMRDIGDPETRGGFIEIGEGRLDIPAILEKGATVGGTRWAIVEHGKDLPMDGWEGLALAAKNILASPWVE